MNNTLAAKWNSASAIDAARRISSMSSIYCGPASAAWIAAVWNQSKGKDYQFIKLQDKRLFPDGPRMFHGRIPGFQLSLDDLIVRETAGELMLAREIYFRVETIHDVLHRYQMPFIIRITGSTLKDGLHYVTLFNSEAVKQPDGSHRFELWWQDNGLFGTQAGFCKKVFNHGTVFPWGAKRIE